ncbi:MAG: 3-phosphoshikimate 1-carboxyvinyltransferase [Eubacteriales bacterium]|nr:3-phosphoshikimate 1-carboxyvinyltransferase [Eubacteriales bacterium]
MIVTITPSKASGRIQAPPSKSMAHRLLLCAGFSAGTSEISNVDFSEDILATLDCLRALGAKIVCKESCVIISGIDPGKVTHPGLLPCRECGSTLRFMIPACLMSGQEMCLTGSRTLFARPLNVYEDICREQNLRFEKRENSLTVAGKLLAGRYVFPGNISSQFVSGLLFALPLLEKSSTITLLPPVESRPYIDLTLDALAQFGVKAAVAPAEGMEGGSVGTVPSDAASSPLVIYVPGGQRYQAGNHEVEGDYSNAAFFEALTLLGGNVAVDGLKEDSLQGDRIYREYFARLQEGFAEADLSDCPDLGPVLMAAAAALHGGRFTGTKRLKYKESDRGAVMKKELGRMKVRVDVSENEIVVYPGLSRPQEILDGHHDHRIVMALAVLLSLTGGSLRGTEAAAKSFPDFFDGLKRLGIKMRLE